MKDRLVCIWRWMASHRIVVGLCLYLAALYVYPSLIFVLPVIGLVNLDPINTATTKNIMPGLADSFFKNDPLMEFLKARHHVYPGGPQIQENFLTFMGTL